MEYTDIRLIRLEIAKAAIAAGLSKEEAKVWVHWVISSEPESEEEIVCPSLKDITEDDLENELFDQFGAKGICWIDFIYAIRSDNELSLKFAVGCCLLYGIRNKTRETVISAIERKDVDGQIPYGCDGQGRSVIQGKYHINKVSLIRWLDKNYEFRGKGIVRQFWDECLAKILLSNVKG